MRLLGQSVPVGIFHRVTHARQALFAIRDETIDHPGQQITLVFVRCVADHLESFEVDVYGSVNAIHRDILFGAGVYITQDPVKMIEIDRLGEKILHTGLVAGVPVPFQHIGGHGDDSRSSSGRKHLLDFTRGLETIHFRHMQIH